MSPSAAVSVRNSSSAFAASISVSEPAALVSMKRRKRSMATPSRRCAARAAGKLRRVLLRLRQGDRIGALDDRAAGRLDEPRHRLGRAVLVVEHLALARAELASSRVGKSRASRTSATRFQPVAHGVRELAAVDEELRPARRRARSRRRAGSGVCGTSPPRMLKSQAIDAGSVRTAASARFSATLLRDLGDLLARPACRRALPAAR